ncbi:bifunctional helix-turn-helix transcriptional regulator/GNAT family N-acetyltransferase [Aquimarina sp. 2201CG14-23]|uniref:bifunctional helix-turn-helix transcriptional regulator/GNAT family N-acetyltransferase n=1 Tax=Aquimarina mycalae TaxID=3040073 RepID=UPI0024781DFE|nr:bifunctional helix-turn-helix transcriptional regulator/GNAT family N-acetyltransferase [Aquimarina sp. 2201CG14-23]MDH7447995.1 bifunctional helix-turn-helix transcriptional regulator/GNAT family N-acetyltransferase [Aquimarina sp. 2201CG14-23]
MDFFDTIGTMAIGSRLRMLSERITEDARQVYELYGVGLKPKWFPVFYVLSQNNEMSITAIAKKIGHSHPSVSKIVREMSRDGIVSEKKDENDGRKNNIMLTTKGKSLAIRMEDQCFDVQSAVDDILDQTKHNMWNAIGEFEFLLDNKSLLKRVVEQKKKRESGKVKIVSYEEKYKEVFKRLNEEWINHYFKMEEMDLKALENPKSYILDQGGHILIALYNKKPVGVCALIKMTDSEYDFELAKMAVSPEAKGKGIGWILGKAIIEKAVSQNAKKIYLESNTVLTPAINLYQKLGFNKVVGNPTPYARCNIQMELDLNK